VLPGAGSVVLLSPIAAPFLSTLLVIVAGPLEISEVAMLTKVLL
jgi:hypothetical protein